MTPELHTARSARILHSLTRLEATDHEMRIEAAMLAGTHLLNTGLHRLGLTTPADDVVHAEYLGGPTRIKADLLAPGLVDLLLQIEMLRPGHVRGDLDGGEAAGTRALELLRQLQERVDALTASRATEGR
ncbi:MAG TPA: hypothetical protein VLK85_26790 [Ramlibacter sp.]|nr:hypothetical protein [Ramlibacter sp.]